MNVRPARIIVLIPDNGRDDLKLTVDYDGAQCGIVRIMSSVELGDGRCIPDYTGVLGADELPKGSSHGPYFYHGRLNER